MNVNLVLVVRLVINLAARFGNCLYFLNKYTSCCTECYPHSILKCAKCASKLKVQVKDCGYDNAEEMVRDRIVFGIKSDKVREKLINHVNSCEIIDITI